MKTKEIHISDYTYDLPDERIAKFPMAERDHSKLLLYRKGEVGEDVFYNLPQYLPEGALMVMNNTRVIQARLHFRKETGALIEIFLLEPAMPRDYEQMFQQISRCQWLCLVGNQKKWIARHTSTPGSKKDVALTREISIKGTKITVTATHKGEVGTSQLIELEWTGNVSFAEVIDVMGELPIPPYLNRETQESDKTTYQTVYSKIKGSVAAPTAGSETIGDHPMHTEYIAVRRHTIERLLAHNGEAIAVGTTSVRTLESLYYMGLKVLQNPDIAEDQLHVNQWEPYDVQRSTFNVQRVLQALLDWMLRNELTVLHSSTQIIIAPGYDYKIVKMLITNFHQPQSTLLLLVSAFVHGDWHKIYDYALAHDFRFLSYGDSSLLIP